VQEAAALYALLKIFPDSVLEEVGMFVPAEEELGAVAAAADAAAADAAADVASGPPPPLGASPDGILCHELRVTAAEAAAACELLHAGDRAGAAREVLRAGLGRVRCAAPAAAESEAGPEAGAAVAAAAAAVNDEAAAAVAVAAGASSPCGGLDGASVEAQLVRWLEGIAASAGPVLGNSDGDRSSGGGEGGGTAAGGGEAGEQMHSLWVREVVEVKSHCPFVMK
jgi:hypothetical protein